jgi:hypothetical protein
VIAAGGSSGRRACSYTAGRVGRVLRPEHALRATGLADRSNAGRCAGQRASARLSPGPRRLPGNSQARRVPPVAVRRGLVAVYEEATVSGASGWAKVVRLAPFLVGRAARPQQTSTPSSPSSWSERIGAGDRGPGCSPALADVIIRARNQ